MRKPAGTIVKEALEENIEKDNRRGDFIRERFKRKWKKLDVDRGGWTHFIDALCFRTWINDMIKNRLKWKKESDTYLTHICRHRWSREIMMKDDENIRKLMKARVLAESSVFILFHHDLSAPAISTDMSQVGVILFS